jgi:hypothetical protein
MIISLQVPCVIFLLVWSRGKDDVSLKILEGAKLLERTTGGT